MGHFYTEGVYVTRERVAKGWDIEGPSVDLTKGNTQHVRAGGTVGDKTHTCARMRSSVLLCMALHE